MKMCDFWHNIVFTVHQVNEVWLYDKATHACNLIVLKYRLVDFAFSPEVIVAFIHMAYCLYKCQ